MKKILAVAAAALLIALAAFILMPSRPSAPAFQAADLNGQAVGSSSLQGKVTLLNFWFPSCPGCVSEMPKLIKTAHDYQGKDFQIIGIAVPVDPLASVQNYAATRRLPFTIVFDGDKNITRSFVKTELYPTSVLLDKQGRIVKTFVGEPDFAKLYQDINSELSK